MAPATCTKRRRRVAGSLHVRARQATGRPSPRSRRAGPAGHEVDHDRPATRAGGSGCSPTTPARGRSSAGRTARSSSTSWRAGRSDRARPRARAAGRVAVADLERAGDAPAAVRPRRRGDERDGRDVADRAARRRRLPGLDRPRLPAAARRRSRRSSTAPSPGRSPAGRWRRSRRSPRRSPSRRVRSDRAARRTHRHERPTTRLDHRDRHRSPRSGPGATRSGPGCGPAARRSSGSTASIPSPFRSQVAAQVDDFDPLAWMPPKTARQLDRFSQFGLVAGRLALDDAGLDAGRGRRRRTRSGSGSTSGSALGGIAYAEEQHERYLEQGHPPGRAEPRAGGLRRRGAGQPRHRARRPRADPVDGELVRVGRGRARRGARATCAKAGSTRRSPAACEIPLSPLAFGAFDIIRALSAGHNDDPGTAARPFDAGRDGFVMGEGAALLVLEAADVAERARRDPVRRAAGLRRDVRRPPHGPAAGRRHARRRARRRSPSTTPASTPDEIDYVNAHASSTPIGDIAEARAIALALGERAATVPVSGTKALYGHPLGASGAIEAAICALAIRDGWAPASVNLVEPDPEIAALLPGLLREGRDGTYRRVLSTSFGFGGLNAALVFGAVDELTRGRSRSISAAERGPAAHRRDRVPAVTGAGSGATPARSTNAPRAAPDQRAEAHEQRQDAADRDRDGHPEGRGDRRPSTRPADRHRAREDRRVDAHHPAAQLVRDGQLDRRVAGRGHQDRAEADERPSAATTTGNDRDAPRGRSRRRRGSARP